MCILGGRGSFGHKAQVKVADDLVNDSDNLKALRDVKKQKKEEYIEPPTRFLKKPYQILCFFTRCPSLTFKITCFVASFNLFFFFLCLLHTVEVAGSNPASPTTFISPLLLIVS